MTNLGDRDIQMPPTFLTSIGVPYWQPLTLQYRWSMEPTTGIMLVERFFRTVDTLEPIDIQTFDVMKMLVNVQARKDAEVQRLIQLQIARSKTKT